MRPPARLVRVPPNDRKFAAPPRDRKCPRSERVSSFQSPETSAKRVCRASLPRGASRPRGRLCSTVLRRPPRPYEPRPNTHREGHLTSGPVGGFGRSKIASTAQRSDRLCKSACPGGRLRRGRFARTASKPTAVEQRRSSLAKADSAGSPKVFADWSERASALTEEMSEPKKKKKIAVL